MTFDARDVAFEWAWTKGWRVEPAGTTVTVRDGEDYVMAEVDLSHVQPAWLRQVVGDPELQKSAIHMAVLSCGLSEKVARWSQKKGRS